MVDVGNRKFYSLFVSFFPILDNLRQMNKFGPFVINTVTFSISRLNPLQLFDGIFNARKDIIKMLWRYFFLPILSTPIAIYTTNRIAHFDQ